MRPGVIARNGRARGTVDLGGSIKSAAEVGRCEMQRCEPRHGLQGPHTVSRSVERHIAASGQQFATRNHAPRRGFPSGQENREEEGPSPTERPATCQNSKIGRADPAATGQTCLRCCPVPSNSRLQRSATTHSADPAAATATTEDGPHNRTLCSTACCNRPHATCQPQQSPPYHDANREGK